MPVACLNAREMERAQPRQFRQLLEGDAFGEVRTHIVLDLTQPSDRQAAAMVRPRRGGVGVLLGQVKRH
jgi:hypothetical protein